MSVPSLMSVIGWGMGPLDQWDRRTDILTQLALAGLEHVADLVLGLLTASDLRMVRLVSSQWLGVVQRSTAHREAGRLGRGWACGEPKLGVMQCSRERSVCTVTALAVDERSIAAGLGSYGKIEVWNRRSLEKELTLAGHKEGVYTVALGQEVVVSGGEDSMVRVWSRSCGDELLVLSHHTYIVWSVQLCGDQLVTAGYDCTVHCCTLKEGACQLVSSVQGPWEWADALFLEESGNRIVVQDEAVFELTVWDVRTVTVISRLCGHTDEVHSVQLRGGLLASGSADTTVRLWEVATGDCVARMEGHEGKVWAVALDRTRLASGGRHGEVRIWPLPKKAKKLMEKIDPDEEEESEYEDIMEVEVPAEGDVEGMQLEEDGRPEVVVVKGRVLYHHPRSTSVSAIHLDPYTLVTGDGLATVLQWDFWQSQSSGPCTKYCSPVADPMELLARPLILPQPQPQPQAQQQPQ